MWSKISYGGESTSYQTYTYLLRQKKFSSTSWKYRQLPIWLKYLNLERYLVKYEYRKG